MVTFHPDDNNTQKHQPGLGPLAPPVNRFLQVKLKLVFAESSLIVDTGESLIDPIITMSSTALLPEVPQGGFSFDNYQR